MLTDKLRELLVDGCEVYFPQIAPTKAIKFTCVIKRQGTEAGGHEAKGQAATLDGAVHAAIENGKQQGWL